MPAQNLLGFVGSSLLELGPWRPIHWWLIATTVGAAGWVSFSGQHRSQWADRYAAWLVWHWVTGGPLEPRRAVTDGSRVRRAAVAAARTAVPVTLVAGEYVRSGAPHGTGVDNVAVSAVAGTVLLAAATLLIVSLAVSTAHYFQWMRPTHQVVHKLAGHKEDKRPGSYLTIRRGLIDGRPPWIVRRARELLHLRPLPDGVIVGVARDFDWRPKRVEDLANAMNAKLELGDFSYKQVSRGWHQSIQFRPRVPMPELVPYQDVTDRIAKARSSEVIFGYTRGGRPVVYDIDSDAPHLLLSTGTGGGKSWTLHMIAAQLMAKGALVAGLDYKRVSHRWLRYLEGDGVHSYAYEIPDIHDSLIALGEEAHRRYRGWDGVDIDDVGAPTFPRLIILCEELNATMVKLKAHWRRIRPRGDTDMMGPAVNALRDILFMGRQVKVHVFGVAQMAIANDLGGPAARENFGIRMYVKTWSKNNWNINTPQCEFQAPTGHDGRGFVVVGDRAVETQFVKMTPEEARALVMEHRKVTVQPPDVRVPAGSVPLGDRAGHVRDTGHLDNGVEPVTLWQASSDNGKKIVALKYWALSKAAQRDAKKGLFPKPVVEHPSRPQYDPRDLQRWELLRTPRRVDTSPVIDVDEVDTTGDEEEVGTEGTERMEARRA